MTDHQYALRRWVAQAGRSERSNTPWADGMIGAIVTMVFSTRPNARNRPGKTGNTGYTPEGLWQWVDARAGP